MMLSSSQQLLEMSAVCPHTRLTPPVNCLVHAVPSVQFVNDVQLRLMHSLLDVTPYLAIDLIEVGAIRRPHTWRNESGC